jgi:hypothetical protein
MTRIMIDLKECVISVNNSVHSPRALSLRIIHRNDAQVMMNTETENMREIMIQGKKCAKILPFIRKKCE